MPSLTFILNWIIANPSAVLTYIGGAGALSIVLETVLTRYHINSKKLAFVMLHLMTILTALASWYMGTSGQAAIGSYAALTIIAQIWHRFAVSGINETYVTPFFKYLEMQKSVTATTTAAPVAATAVAGDAKPFTLDQPSQ